MATIKPPGQGDHRDKSVKCVIYIIQSTPTGTVVIEIGDRTTPHNPTAVEQEHPSGQKAPGKRWAKWVNRDMIITLGTIVTTVVTVLLWLEWTPWQ